MATRSIRAAYRIALIGTPIENSVGDPWSIMEFLISGLPGAQSEFRQNRSELERRKEGHGKALDDNTSSSEEPLCKVDSG